MKKILKKIIKNRLNKTKDCGFKKEWIPKGWACVKISVFTEDVTEEILKALKE